MVTSISGVQSTVTLFFYHECNFGETPHYEMFCNLLPEVRCASD